MKDQDFDANARKLLLHRLLQGSPNGVDYSPDYRNGAPGPLTVQISKILRAHAALWANDMREHQELGVGMDGKAAWLLHMREADAEINRFLAGHRLTTGHAA